MLLKTIISFRGEFTRSGTSRKGFINYIFGSNIRAGMRPSSGWETKPSSEQVDVAPVGVDRPCRGQTGREICPSVARSSAPTGRPLTDCSLLSGSTRANRRKARASSGETLSTRKYPTCGTSFLCLRRRGRGCPSCS